MKIAVFEWLCGGGMRAVPPHQIPSSLRREGWAMLRTMVQLLDAAKHEVATVVDHRLVDPLERASLPARDWGGSESYADSSSCSDVQRTIRNWQVCIREARAELAVIIAPEIDGVLQQVVSSLQADQTPVLNCSGKLLARSCDKWLTAVSLQDTSIPHPLTHLTSDVSDLSAEMSDLWCLKSRLGAGCDGMWLGNFDQLLQAIDRLADKSNWIVQPWLNGHPYSCSAIVDRWGVATWMPLVTQSFDYVPDSDLCHSLLYRGGSVVASADVLRPPVELLNGVLTKLQGTPNEALGWVGVDLLLQPNCQWVVIEVNPRITTSILGLCRAAPYNLAQRMVDAFLGVKIEPDTKQEMSWNSTDFTPESSRP